MARAQLVSGRNSIVLTGIGGAIWYVGGLILDKHVQSAVVAANAPLQTDIRRMDGEVQQVRAVVNVLQAQIAAQKYTVVPIKDLKNHRDELNNIKGKLATLPNNTPGYWPTTFQIIALVSKATSELEQVAQQPGESVYDNVSGNPARSRGSRTESPSCFKKPGSGNDIQKLYRSF